MNLENQPAPAPEKPKPEWQVFIENFLPFTFWTSLAVFFTFFALMTLAFSYRSFAVAAFSLSSLGIIIGRWDINTSSKPEKYAGYAVIILSAFVFLTWLFFFVWRSFGAGGMWGA